MFWCIDTHTTAVVPIATRDSLLLFRSETTAAGSDFYAQVAGESLLYLLRGLHHGRVSRKVQDDRMRLSRS